MRHRVGRKRGWRGAASACADLCDRHMPAMHAQRGTPPAPPNILVPYVKVDRARGELGPICVSARPLYPHAGEAMPASSRLRSLGPSLVSRSSVPSSKLSA